MRKTKYTQREIKDSDGSNLPMGHWFQCVSCDYGTTDK